MIVTQFSDHFFIDDLAFYNKALSAEEVSYLALDRLVASNNLIALWRFNGSFADERNEHNGQIEGQNPGYNVGHFLCEADSGDTGGILCDSVLETPVCDPSSDICPIDQICNPNTCYCEIAPDLGTESTYTWSFTTNSFAPRVVELCNRSPLVSRARFPVRRRLAAREPRLLASWWPTGLTMARCRLIQWSALPLPKR
jgi:hypothetical protein